MNKPPIQAVPGFKLRQQQAIEADILRHKSKAKSTATHVTGEVTWSEAIINTYWETADALILEIEDGTTRRMNRENWGSTFEATRDKVLQIIPRRTYKIGTWGKYSGKSWFCDIEPSTKPEVDAPSSAPWIVLVSNVVQTVRNCDQTAEVRNGVSKYILNIPIDGEAGLWIYEFQHRSRDRTVGFLTKQKFIKSTEPSQPPFLGKCFDIDIENFLEGQQPTLLNLTSALEKLYFSKLPNIR